MPPELAWLPVRATEGAFSSEYAIAIATPDGDISLFADKTIVKQEGGQYYLQVTHMGQDTRTGEKIMLLPSECFETGTRWHRVAG
ncbi:MAG: hypothetical protein RIT26_116 [Pseudomonadota bacterium]